MAAPSVIGYMALCVTPRSQICDEQGVGQWPMWKRFDSVRKIIDKYIDEPYRSFLALPYHEVDKLKAEELFYWYTPRCETTYSRLSCMADDYDHYKRIFDDTLKHYMSVMSKLKNNGSIEEATFLQLALKFVGDSEDNVYCGDGRVVATMWGMRQRYQSNNSEYKLSSEFVPELDIHTITFDIGAFGSTANPVSLKKTHGSRIYEHQVPEVTANKNYLFSGWGDRNPVGMEVTQDMRFVAQYRELTPDEQHDAADVGATKPEGRAKDESQETDDAVLMHHVRFLTPDSEIIKEFDVEHGKHIMPGKVPQLPVVSNVICPSWDGDPLNDIINSDHDYRATNPNTSKIVHTVRFYAPDGRLLSKTQVDHGSIIPNLHIPPLPVVNGKVCTSWSDDPHTVVIDKDWDFFAKMPQAIIDEGDRKKWHNVRFLNLDGNEMAHLSVSHGSRLLPEQIPVLPTLDDKRIYKWSPNPLKHDINNDIDFTILERRKWNWLWTQSGSHSFWRWLLYIAAFILLVILVLYVMYLNDPCSR